jgi:hypothetical protein
MHKTEKNDQMLSFLTVDDVQLQRSSVLGWIWQVSKKVHDFWGSVRVYTTIVRSNSFVEMNRSLSFFLLGVAFLNIL